MHKTLASDELWKIIESHLPPDPSREKGGRPRIPNRNAFAGIVYVLKSGVPWRMLPKEVGGGRRHNVLASSARLAESRRVVAATPHPARPSWQGRPIRLVEGQSRLCQHPGKRGARRPVPTHWTAVAPARSDTSSPTQVVCR
jgi:transposase